MCLECGNEVPNFRLPRFLDSCWQSDWRVLSEGYWFQSDFSQQIEATNKQSFESTSISSSRTWGLTAISSLTQYSQQKGRNDVCLAPLAVAAALLCISLDLCQGSVTSPLYWLLPLPCANLIHEPSIFSINTENPSLTFCLCLHRETQHILHAVVSEWMYLVKASLIWYYLHNTKDAQKLVCGI